MDVASICRMTRTILYILTLLFFDNQIYGQKIIHGLILNEESRPLPGVTVIETSNESRAITDINGKFDLIILSDTSCIKTSVIGYKDTILCDLSKSSLTIKLFSDIKSSNDIDIGTDHFYINYFYYGYYSGLLNTPYGISLYSYNPILFKIPINFSLMTAYRTNFNKNYDFNLKARKYFNINSRKWGFGLQYEYLDRKIIIDNSSEKFISNNVNSILVNRRFSLSLGFGQLKDNKDNYGLLTGFSIDLYAISAGIGIESNYWNGFWQNKINLSKQIFKTNFVINLGYEQMRNYKEINLKVSHYFTY